MFSAFLIDRLLFIPLVLFKLSFLHEASDLGPWKPTGLRQSLVQLILLGWSQEKGVRAAALGEQAEQGRLRGGPSSSLSLCGALNPALHPELATDRVKGSRPL